MNTSVNGKDAVWPEQVQKLWDTLTDFPKGKLVTANWFTARPWIDEYNRGSEHEGFVFTVLQGYDHHVFETKWRVGRPAAAYSLPKTPS
jgi:hypothetical protein